MRVPVVPMDVFEQECTEFVQSQRGARFGAPEGNPSMYFPAEVECGA